ncbi:MAG: hypothetical protein LBH58_13445 [Tannerellaceae bacterium]|jgi:hypothetical protein|nr:hypothetical protein [Tannerellaceae bacterium]
MLDSILDLVKGPVTEAITKSKDVPTTQKKQAIDATTNAITDTLKSSIKPENISQLTSLFTGGSKATSSSNFLTEGIKSAVVGVLSQKFGMSKTVSGAIASAIIPPLMNILSSKVSGGKGSGIDVGGLIGMFGGGGKSSNSKGDIAGNVIGALGHLLKK